MLGRRLLHRMRNERKGNAKLKLRRYNNPTKFPLLKALIKLLCSLEYMSEILIEKHYNNNDNDNDEGIILIIME